VLRVFRHFLQRGFGGEVSPIGHNVLLELGHSVRLHSVESWLYDCDLG
jgi:hypothetical protein